MSSRTDNIRRSWERMWRGRRTVVVAPVALLITFLLSAAPALASSDVTLTEVASVLGRNLAIDSNDNLYVSCYSDNKVQKVTPGGVVSDLATGIYRPRDGVCDADDNLYVGDYNGRVWKINSTGGKTQIASGIWSIQGLALDGSGHLYVSSGYDDTIYRIDLSTNARAVFSTAFLSSETYPARMIVDQESNQLYVTVAYHTPFPAGGPEVSLARMDLDDSSSYEVVASLPGWNGNGTLYFNTNGNLLWSCLLEYVYDPVAGVWTEPRYESPILEVEPDTGTWTESLAVDGLFIEGMAFDSSGQFFVAGTSGPYEPDPRWRNHVYRVEEAAPPNQPPVLGPIGPQTVNEGEELSIVLGAADPDPGDTLTYIASGLPAGASFADGVFTWTPGFDQSGAYALYFEVSDSIATDSETVEITVLDVPPEQATEKLIEEMQEELGLPSGTENSFVSTMESAIESFENGNTGAGRNKLNALVNKIKAQSGKKIAAEDGQKLIKGIESIIEAG